MPKLDFNYEQPEHSPGFLLWQVTVSWQRSIKSALEPYSVTHPQFVILALLLWFTEQGTVAIQSQLIDMSKLDKMTVSGAVKKLASLGFIDRSECQHDSRAKTVSLTDSGLTLTRELVSVVEALDKRFFSKLSRAEERDLLKLLAGVL
jgi:MarR family transcriptional regulator, organic hydroperoxide resistance regulator